MEDKDLKEVFQETFTVFRDYYDENSDILVNATRGDFASINTIAILFSECIIEDFVNILSLKEQEAPHRYIDGIARNICEHVIEFLYLFKNQDKVIEYFGIGLSEEELRRLEEDDNIFMVIRKIAGDKRYSTGRNILNMAKDIGEVEENSEGLPLYDIFQYYSTVYHNSYLENLSELTDEAEQEEPDPDLDYMMFIFILERFFNCIEKLVESLS